MTDEIDAGQEQDEIPIQGQHQPHVQASDMTELGLDRRRVAEWRAVRDKGEESCLRHPRHCHGLHIWRYLIAVLGLDHPFMGLAAINVYPQHIYGSADTPK